MSRPLSIAALLCVCGALPVQAVASAFNATPTAQLPLASQLGCADLWGVGDHLAVALQDGGVAWLEIATPAQPQLLDQWNPGDVLVQSVHGTEQWVAVANASYNGVAAYLLSADGADRLLERARIEVPHGLEACHDLWFDPRGYLYCATESFVTGAQVRIYDLRHPGTGIIQVGAFDYPGAVAGDPEGVAIRQLMVQDEVLYMAWGAGGAVRADLQDPAAPRQIGAPLIHAGERTAAVWPTADGTHLLTCDERAGGEVRVWEVADPGEEQEVAAFSVATPAIPHRVRIKGDLAYLAYYEAGTRVLDIAQPAAPVEVAFDEPFADPPSGQFAGIWGVWPFQNPENEPGSHEEIYLSDTHGQLFVVGLDGPRRARVRGHLQWDDGTPVAQATLRARESGHSSRTDLAGDYVLDTGAAEQTIDIAGFAARDTSILVTLQPGDDLRRDLTLAASPDPDVVVVDADGGTAREDPIENWLTELNLEWQTWDVAGAGLLPPERLAGFSAPPVIIWNTGALAVAPLDAAARDTLDQLLNAGHPLLLAGEYIGDSLVAEPEWLAARFGAEHIADQVNMPYLQGPEGDPVTGDMFLALDTSDSEWGQESPGQVAATAGALPLLYYSGTTFGAGVRHAGATVPTVYLEFGLEGLQESGGLTAPVDFLGAVLSWLGAPVEIGAEEPRAVSPPLADSGLRGVFPNPFNPRTTIEFVISPEAAAGTVDMSVYSMSGQKVATLVQGRLSSGRHRVSWDARAANGKTLASGCYFCRLATRAGTERRTLLLLK